MALIPSREDILRLLDELDKGKIADDLESETRPFPDARDMTWMFGGEPFTMPRARTSPWKSKPSMRRKGGSCSSARPKE